jgi:homoserine O-acetyltransferase
MNKTGAFAMKTLHTLLLGAAAGLLAACATPEPAQPPAAPVAPAAAPPVAAAPVFKEIIESPAKAVLTPNSNIPDQDKLKRYYTIPNFRLGGKYNLDAHPDTWRNGGEGGTTLESLGSGPLQVAYIAVGTPKRNDKGEIINAVIISTFYSGDSTWMYNTWYAKQPANAFSGGDVVGPGLEIDTDKHYVVFLDAIGLWGASKPSHGLGRKFPQYNYQDMVVANHRLLKDHLNVGQVELATGVSMGATQTWVWGVMYSPSGYVKAIMPIGGATASDGDDPVGQWTFRLGTAAIESDPNWRATNGNYYHLPKEKHPNQGMQFMWSVLQMTGYTFPVRSATPWKNLQREVFYWEPKGEETAVWIARVKNEDAVDYWYRNSAGFNHNFNKELKRIKARTLVVHVTNDQWLLVDNARKAAAAVPGAAFATLSDPQAHYGVFRAPNVLADTIKAFIDNDFTASLPGVGGGSSGGGGSAPAKPAGLAK